MAKLAVIDIGTVSVRLAIVDIDGSQPTNMSRVSTICNLGEGVSSSGRIHHTAIERVCACIDTYLAHAREQQVSYVVCTITSAARDAINAIDLLAELSLWGLVPQVIPGDVEAALAFLGAAQDFKGSPILVCDSGGGSTELAYGSYAAQKLSLPFVRSIPVGCRQITERFLAEHDPPQEDELIQAHEVCKRSFAEAGQLQVERLVCCGGTATSLVSMVLGLEEYDPAQVHLYELTREIVLKLEQEMALLSAQQRSFVIGLQPQRASVILGGIVVLGELMDAVQVPSVTVTENDLLMGLAIVAGLVVNGTKSPLTWKPSIITLR